MQDEIPLTISLLGEMEVLRDGQALDLPRSKKTRALLAYLALADRPQRREHLCTVFWDLPDDPKGALRWSLSKLRPVLDEKSDKRLQADRNRVWLEGLDTAVDARRLKTAAADGDALDIEELEALVDAGGLLEDFSLPRCPDFEAWLAAERENIRAARLSLLDTLIERHRDDPARAVDFARARADLDPYDAEARITFIEQLVSSGRSREAERQVQLARDALRDAELPVATLDAAWARLRDGRPAPTPASVATSLQGQTPEDVEPSESSLLPKGLALPPRPSIAVLPFTTLSQDPERHVFADGLTYDLISRLSSLRWLFVIARGSSFAFRDKADDLQAVAGKLGVRYIAQGSVQSSGDRIRVHAALIDAIEGAELWAEQFDRNLDDIFAIQDQISNAITGALETEIVHAEQRRALLKPPESLDAWSAYHRGLWHMYRQTKDNLAHAELLFHRAKDLDKTFPRPLAGLSFVHFQRGFLGHSQDHAREYARALEAAEESIALDARDSLGHWALGRALLMCQEHDRSIEALETSVSLNPNFAGAQFSLSRSLFAEGSSERGIESTDIARRLSPVDPQHFAMLSVRGNCLAQLGRFDEAADWVMRAVRQPNAHHHILAIATYCTSLAGRRQDSADCLRRLVERKPDYKSADFFQAFPLKREEHRALVLEGLAKAGFSD